MDADTSHTAPPPASERRRTGQLRLLELRDHPEWCLDESTREAGRRGVEAARAALRAARHHDDDDPHRAQRPSTAA